MRRSAVTLVAFLLVSACNENVQSQEREQPPQRISSEIAAGADAISLSRQNAITHAVQVASPAVVSINAIKRAVVRETYSDPIFELFFGQQRSRLRERRVQNVGSGFVISDDGYIVTNDHVTSGADEVTVSFTGGRTLAAEIIGTDVTSDLTLLKVEPEDPLPYLAFADGPPIVGEWCIALGNPFGLFQAAEPTVTVGVVSAIGRDLAAKEDHVYYDMIQTDAAINSGNSGGPLLNAVGEVIGVNTAIISPAGGSVGIGFAVPSERARRVVDDLRENGFVDRSYYTGLRVREVNARLARALRLDEARGVFVESVEPGSPAEKAGFSPYDVIVAVEDEPIATRNEIVGRMYDFRPGDAVGFTVVRDGQAIDLLMTLGGGTR